MNPKRTQAIVAVVVQEESVGVSSGLWWSTTNSSDASNSENLGTFLGIAKQAIGRLRYCGIQLNDQGYVCGNRNGVVLMVLYTEGGPTITQTVVCGATGDTGGQEGV